MKHLRDYILYSYSTDRNSAHYIIINDTVIGRDEENSVAQLHFNVFSSVGIRYYWCEGENNGWVTYRIFFGVTQANPDVYMLIYSTDSEIHAYSYREYVKKKKFRLQ